MITQQITVKLPTCENRGRIDDNTVFCGRVDRYINADYCLKCSPERKQRETYEW